VETRPDFDRIMDSSQLFDFLFPTISRGRRKGHPRSSAAPFRAATHADYSTRVPFRFLGFWPGAHEDAFLFYVPVVF
jgi:hypothetical protein